MSSRANLRPTYPISTVKRLLRANNFRINTNALQGAYDDFGWGQDEITKCLLKLNDKYYIDEPSKNHFYKFEPHRNFPNTNTMMDYYKIENGLEGNRVYTHLYIHPNSGKLIISSFKELQTI